jgi:uncharacterized protein YndB with AHSA1/START domain
VTDRYAFSITRVFDAPRERVWQEWTTPESFADWFGGAGGEVPMSTVDMDVRPGGAWKLTMFAGPARHEIHWWGEFRELVEPERLVFTISDRPDAYAIITVELADLGDGRTEMSFEQSGEGRPEDYEGAKQGWGTFFDRVDERLAGQQSTSTVKPPGASK